MITRFTHLDPSHGSKLSYTDSPLPLVEVPQPVRLWDLKIKINVNITLLVLVYKYYKKFHSIILIFNKSSFSSESYSSSESALIKKNDSAQFSSTVIVLNPYKLIYTPIFECLYSIFAFFD